jgi:predicted PurR-regulated permease PerM
MLTGSIGSLSGFVINLFLVPIYIFFLLYYRHFFIEFFYKIFHDSEKDLIDETLEKIKMVINGYLFGLFLDVLVVGIINSLALYLVGVGYPIILGFIISIFCIIPYIGMIAGSLIALITAFVTTDASWQPPVAFATLWFIHIIDSNILAPSLIGSKVSINPLMSIVMIFLFGEMWGLPGLFLAFPLTAIIKVIFDTVPALKPYGFLLGEPEKYHLKRHSLLHIKKLHNLIERRKNKIPPPEIPGEIGKEDIAHPAKE